VKRHNFRTKATDWIDSFTYWIDSDNRKTKSRWWKLYEDWCKSRDEWNDSTIPDGCLNRYKIIVNRFRESQRVWWYDSRRNDTIQTWIESYTVWIDSHKVRKFYETIQTGMSRFMQTGHKWKGIKMNNYKLPH